MDVPLGSGDVGGDCGTGGSRERGADMEGCLELSGVRFCPSGMWKWFESSAREPNAEVRADRFQGGYVMDAIAVVHLVRS